MISKSKSTKLLKEYIKQLLGETSNEKTLRIFDFDDTLVVTDAVIRVVNNDTMFELTPSEFAIYDKKKGDVFDYSQFDVLVNPRPVLWTLKMLHNAYKKHGAEALVVLSARTLSKPIKAFMKTIGLSDVSVVALNDPDPTAKVKWITKRIKKDELEFVEFFDDSIKNIDAVKRLNDTFPQTKIVVRHVMHTHVPTHGFTRHYGTLRKPVKRSQQTKD